MSLIPTVYTLTKGRIKTYAAEKAIVATRVGYVVFAVSTNRVSAADAATSTSPKTGRPLYPFWLLAAAAALAAGTAIMVAVLPKRKKN